METNIPSCKTPGTPRIIPGRGTQFAVGIDTVAQFFRRARIAKVCEHSSQAYFEIQQISAGTFLKMIFANTFNNALLGIVLQLS